MRRVPFFAALLPVVATAALVLGSAQLRTGAQTGTPAAADQGFVGAWRLTFDTPLGPSQSLLTVMADGTVLFSGRPVSPAAGETPVTFSSAGHGVWEQTGPTTAATTWVGLVTDGEGTLHRRFGAGAECFYLVRPDGYVGHRERPIEPKRLEAELARRLGPPGAGGEKRVAG